MTRYDDFLPGADDRGEPFLVHAPRSASRAHALGALVGLAVGDALGTTLEFSAGHWAPFPRLLDGPHTEIIGGGPFNLAAGQVTDDTQMATALARSMMRCGGFVADDVAARYAEWVQHAFDAGFQTRAALQRARDGLEPADAGLQTWLASGQRAAGNGSLMRTVPIAVFYQPDAQRRRDVSMEDAAITHFDPRCQLACAAFNGAIAAALDRPAASSGPADRDAMFAAARVDLDAAHRTLRARNSEYVDAIDRARGALAADLDAADRDDPDLLSREVHLQRMGGFVRVAFRLAFWHLRHTDDFEAALVDVVNRGADADTNGAIAGALLGARLGVDAIPRTWRDSVVNALDGQTGPWAETYHPRHLFELVPGG